MKKTILTLGVALASLFAANAFAQADQPGESKAVPSTPTTANERAAAKKARKAEGKDVTNSKKSNADAMPENMGSAKSHSKQEHKSAAAKRKSEGAKAQKEPKDHTAGAGGSS